MADFGDLVIRWTVRLAMALYAACLGMRLLVGPRRPWTTVARLAWTLGFVFFLTHVACAFHFVHHWSHAAAYDHTAQQTAEITGFAWGGGLYLNYLFVFVWGVDVLWWWRDTSGYLLRSRWPESAIQGFLAFIAFNATVVFGTGVIRWYGLMVSALLGMCLAYAYLQMKRRGRRQRDTGVEPV